jgi:hypothetical protein
MSDDFYDRRGRKIRIMPAQAGWEVIIFWGDDPDHPESFEREPVICWGIRDRNVQIAITAYGTMDDIDCSAVALRRAGDTEPWPFNFEVLVPCRGDRPRAMPPANTLTWP